MSQYLSLTELEDLLTASFMAARARQVEFKARLAEVFGQSEESDPRLSEMVEERMARIVARQLWIDDRSQPLLDSSDFADIISELVDEVAASREEEPSPEERAAVGNAVGRLFQSLADVVNEVVPGDADPYVDYWRWIDIVYAVAAERGMTPKGVLFDLGAFDEVMRRLRTRDEYIAITSRSVASFTDADRLFEAIAGPMVDMLMPQASGLGREVETSQQPEGESVDEIDWLPDDLVAKLDEGLPADEFAVGPKEGLPEVGEISREDAIEFVRALVMPEFAETIARLKNMIDAWLAEQVVRIYGE